jgi:hypothetical protein
VEEVFDSSKKLKELERRRMICLVSIPMLTKIWKHDEAFKKMINNKDKVKEDAIYKKYAL